MGRKIVEFDENLSDDAIVSLVNSGDFEPVGILINRYYPTILMFVKQLCPQELYEDAIQEATLALYSAIRSYDSQKSSFSTFAGICIKRAVISFMKAQNQSHLIKARC